jgi:hypothetical protein
MQEGDARTKSFYIPSIRPLLGKVYKVAKSLEP